MSRLLALEWDAKEARVVVGRERGRSVVVEQAFAVPLPPREAGATAEGDVGAIVAQALSERGLSKSEALVAVGRSNIELKFLSTPPVPEEELPDLVRFQALRQFTSLGDDWPLDFVPLSPNADGGLNVLAAAISPELVGQIRQTCAGAGVSVSRLVLRPFAAASLIADETSDGKCRMVVDLLRDDADLTVLIGPQVIFPRTVRLPAVAEPEALARVVLAEGRRTMIAAQNQLGGRKVDEVVIFGDGQHHSALKTLLEKELSLDVKLVDPFDKVELGPEAKAASQALEYPGTFAPLLGMLLDEAAERPPVIDFLHPRKKPLPPDKRRLYVLASAAVAALVLFGFFLLQLQLWALDDQIGTLRRQLTETENKAKLSAKPKKDAEKLEKFAAGDIVWLEELARVSREMPPATAVIVQELHAAPQNKQDGGTMTLKGVADQKGTVAQIENKLASERHQVVVKGATPDQKLKGLLTLRFSEEIIVDPPSKTPSATDANKAQPASRKTAPAASSRRPKQPGGGS